MTLRYYLAYQEIILVHPTRRQFFAGQPYSTFWNIWDLFISCRRHYHLEKEVNVDQVGEEREGDAGKEVFSHVLLVFKMMASRDGSNWKSKHVSIFVEDQKVKRNCIKYLPNTLFPNVPCKHIVLKGSNATIILRKLRLCGFDGITFLRLPNPVHVCQNLNHPSPRQTLPAFVCENVPTRIFWSGNPK